MLASTHNVCYSQLHFYITSSSMSHVLILGIETFDILMSI